MLQWLLANGLSCLTPPQHHAVANFSANQSVTVASFVLKELEKPQFVKDLTPCSVKLPAGALQGGVLLWPSSLRLDLTKQTAAVWLANLEAAGPLLCCHYSCSEQLWLVRNPNCSLAQCLTNRMHKSDKLPLP